MGNALTQNMASVYLQRQLGKPSDYLGECINIDSIPSPLNGGVETIWCKDGRGGWRKKGIRKTPPGNIEYSLVELSEADSRLVEELDCAFNIHVLWSECGANGVMRNWDRGASVLENTLNDNTLTNVAHATEQAELMNELALVAAPPRLDYRRLTMGRSTTTEIQGLNAVMNASTLFCGDKCGAYRLPTDVLYAVADGAVAASANVLKSDDKGVTWAALAADPYGVNINLLSIAVFDITRDTQRILVARAGVAATAMNVAYSDDDGATWTLVAVGATVLEGATGPRSLWALDSEHIWLCTDEGNVYFSNDGGETWTLQPSSAAAGGLALNCVHFADEMVGMAVGATDTVILTLNGGQTWYAGTPTGNGNDLKTCWIFNTYRMLAGSTLDATGSLWMSFDATDTWEAKQFTGWTTEDVNDVYFYNAARGIMITEVGAVSSVFGTIDGGHIWEEMTTPLNAGINAVVMTALNRFAVVGEPQGGTSYIATAN